MGGFSIKKLLAISIVLILLSLSAVAASDDSQSIAIDENSDIQVPDTLLSSASDDLISADAGENDASIYGASENLANDISSDEKENVTMDISVDKDVINAGEKAAITVTLPSNATGVVSFGLWFVNVTEGGVASYNYTSKSVGNHTITVIYYGNEIYNMAKSSLNITVLEAAPKENVTMKITASPDEIVEGENSTITVQLPDDATGIVSFGLWFVNVTGKGGVVTYNYTSKSAGNHTVTVIYYGDKKYNLATGSVNVTVLEAPPKENVTMKITASPNEIKEGENSTITVQLPDDATGIVSIGLWFVNVTGKGGVVTYNYTSKSAGNHTVTVIYYGDKKYNFAMDSVNITVLEVPKENVTMTITADPDEIYPGDNTIVTVKLSEDATGIVSIGLWFVNVTDGVAVANVTGLIRGNYSLPVIYYGDKKYNYAIDSVNITVLNTPPKENVTMLIVAVPDEVTVGYNSTVTVILPENATGKVSIGLHLVDIIDGVAVANVTSLVKGTISVPVIYYGNENYNIAYDSVNVTFLSKQNTTMAIVADPETVYVGENATVTVILPDDATGIVSIGLHFVNVTDGVAVANVTSLVKGTISVPVIYYGDKDYKMAYDTVNVTFLKHTKENVTMDIFVVPDEVYVGENATVTVILPENATGIVSIGLNFVNVTNGVAFANVTSLVKGTIPVPVIYYGDENYKYAIDFVNVTFLSAKQNVTMDITVAPDEVYVGENATVTVTLPENATGIVSIGVWFVNVTKTGGVAVANVTNLIKGNLTVPVIYYGDENYKMAYDSVNIAFLPHTKENTTMTIIAVPENVYVGENSTVRVFLPENATGIVSIGLHFVNVTDGVAVANVTSLVKGTIPVPVIYYGDKHHKMAYDSVNVTFLSAKQNTTMTIIAVPENVYVGENSTVRVFLPENATGKVSIGLHLVNVTDGVAVANVTSLIKGTIPVPVIYYGDDNYKMALDTVNVTFLAHTKENTTMTIIAIPDEVTVGENATVFVTLPENATGIVSIGLHLVNVTDGVAVANVTSLIKGTIPVPVIYYGDKHHKMALDTVNVTFLSAKQEVNMTIIAVPEVIYVGENSTVRVFLPENATGLVSIGLTIVNVTDGVAMASVRGLAKGNITVPVIYFGDKNYKMAYDSVNVTVLSTKKNPEMNVTADKDIITVRENVTFVVELPEDATGKVSIGLKMVNVTNGIATATITSYITGKIPVPVIYYGDDNYTMEMKIYNLTVKKGTEDVITAPDVTKYYKGSERFVVNVTDYQGNPLANKTVEIFINNVTYTRTTDENGTASMALGLNSGVYNVTTTVDKQSVDSVVTILATVNGTDVVKVFRNATQYYATFLDTEGNYLPDGTEVTFNINGVMYKRYINGTEGKARLNLNLEQGTYIITAINPVNGEMAANNITILPRITNNENLVKYYRNDSQYYVTLIGDDGNPVGAGETVIFNINGVFYERQTNESGVARLNINIEPGEYIITAEYKECRVSNNITVLPVLSASDLTKKYGTPGQFVANLVDGQGKPFANEKIEFNINGVFYYRTTNSTGQAALNINLMPGEYIITSSYNGANIANTVKVEA